MSNTPANTSSCRYCGKELDPGKDFCKYCGTTTYDEVCPFCKAPVPPGATVCSGCSAEKMTNENGLLATFVGVPVGLIVIGAIVMLFFDQSRTLGLILLPLALGAAYLVGKQIKTFNGKWTRRSIQ